MTAHYPAELLYHPEHVWARVDGDEAALGITWFAQSALNEVVYVELPLAGATVVANEPYATVESLKTMSDVFAPLSGEVTGVNEELRQRPDLLNTDPHGRGWIVRIRLADHSEQAQLLASKTYTALVAG